MSSNSTPRTAYLVKTSSGRRFVVSAIDVEISVKAMAAEVSEVVDAVDRIAAEPFNGDWISASKMAERIGVSYVTFMLWRRNGKITGRLRNQRDWEFNEEQVRSQMARWALQQ